MADEARYEQLIKKRSEAGLSDEEANELGRLLAVRAGQEYSNARGRDEPDAGLDEDTSVDEAALAEAKWADVDSAEQYGPEQPHGGS
jgi:hypothetical protein